MSVINALFLVLFLTTASPRDTCAFVFPRPSPSPSLSSLTVESFQRTRSSAYRRVSTTTATTTTATTTTTTNTAANGHCYGSLSSLVSASSSSSSNEDIENTSKVLPIVELIDPMTQCQVVLLGCFHGTRSSSQDVHQVITPDTDIVVLELCATRFQDLQSQLVQKQSQNQNQKALQKPWILAYLEMISKTIQKRGLATGMAAAILGGVSGFQTALSGFTPGLEFTTALEQAQLYQCDVVLADQAVEETLRKVGTLPRISWEMLTRSTSSSSPLQEWKRHQETLQRAVLGDSNTTTNINNNNGNAKNNIHDDGSLPSSSSSSSSSPQVQIGSVLIRNAAAIQDLVRLTIPPTILYLATLQCLTHFGIPMSPPSVTTATTTSFFMDNAYFYYYYYEWIMTMIPHLALSFIMVILGYVGVALPAVKVILTERDDVLTQGIRAACQRAGSGGRVVAVLGLLHVNGVAKRLLQQQEDNDNDNSETMV